MLSIVRRIVLFATILSATPVLAQEQSGAANANPGPMWLVNCSNQANQNALACAMSQTIFESQSRQRIVTANIFQTEPGRFAMRLLLPHGLDLTKGVTLAVDNGATGQHGINTADSNGSYALIPLNNELIEAMKAGNVANVGISNMNGNSLRIEMSLDGFSSSFALLSR